MTFDADSGEYGPTITAAPTVIDIDEPEPTRDWDDDPNPSNHVPAIKAAKERAKAWLAAQTSPEWKASNEARIKAATAGKGAMEDPRVQQQIAQQVSTAHPQFGPYAGLMNVIKGSAAALEHAPQVMGVPGMAVQAAQHFGERAQGKGELQRLSQTTRDAEEEAKSRELQLKALATAKRLAAEKGSGAGWK